MIVVIADDFTGAAEIGGIGLRFGLNVEIQIDTAVHENVDLLIVATDSRAMPEKEAFNEVYSVTENLCRKNFDLIYKKSDSVLRGHVLPELKAFMKAANRENLIFVPANPNFGRTISGGTYYINNIPLHETGFASDPEFPAKVSDVKELLRVSEENNVDLVSVCDESNKQGLIVGEAVNISDLDCWAERAADEPLSAGAAGFFHSLLKAKGYKLINGDKKEVSLSEKKCLYVCGSSIESSRHAIESARKSGAAVSEMPDTLIKNGCNVEDELESWAREIINLLKKSPKVIMAINKPLIKEKGIPQKLRSYVAEVTLRVFNEVNIDELFIEGGATTYSLIEKNNFKEFIPLQELAHGVLRMQVAGERNLMLTIKPGSYAWPGQIWNF
jgi:uncharacterized protein YgbK (DUF1537 family)